MVLSSVLNIPLVMTQVYILPSSSCTLFANLPPARIPPLLPAGATCICQPRKSDLSVCSSEARGFLWCHQAFFLIWRNCTTRICHQWGSACYNQHWGHSRISLISRYCFLGDWRRMLEKMDCFPPLWGEALCWSFVCLSLSLFLSH